MAWDGMKIQCDVCEKVEASVFCGADEAALCEGCDHRAHHANKLATKHQRFPLLHPSSSPPSQHHLPLCDICHEKRAFVFCREDRAILCRECDTQIHKANEHTQSHHRFLLTGVKISPTLDHTYPNSSSYSNSNSNSNSSNSAANSNSNSKTNNPNTSTSSATDYSTMFLNEQDCYGLSNADDDMMSGWRLEDLLHSSNNYAVHVQSSKTTLEAMNNVNPHNNQVEEESMGSFCTTQSHTHTHTQVDQYYSRIMWDFSPPSPITCAFPSSLTDRL